MFSRENGVASYGNFMSKCKQTKRLMCTSNAAIHNICSYSQTQLSIMSLIKSSHLATGFDQTWSSSGHIHTKIKEVHVFL